MEDFFCKKLKCKKLKTPGTSMYSNVRRVRKSYILTYMRVEQKVLNRGLHCEGPGVCNYQSRLKFFPEMAKENFLLAKDLAKVYVYVICI